MDLDRLNKRIKLVEATLDEYYKAEIAILGGAQQYTVGSRSLTRANLAEVRRAITEYENLLEDLKALANGGGRNKMVGGIPIDY